MRILPVLLLAAATLAAQDTASDAHVAAARAAAGTDYQNFLNFQCYGPGPGGQRTPPGAPQPRKANRVDAEAVVAAVHPTAPLGTPSL
ncbi:MAG: hypothetical protein WDO18_22095 [Acidobacteriota bacterium]